MIPPVADFADSPTVQAPALGAVWLGYVLGALEALASDSAWDGTESEIFDATQNIESIMRGLAVGGGAVGDVIPVATIMQFAGSTAPAGWLFCNGASFDPATYADLFAVVGTTYGGTAGAPLLPDFRGRAPIGVGTGTDLTARALADKVGTETHVLTLAQMPAHTHVYGRRNAISFSLVNSGSPTTIAGSIPNADTSTAGSGSAHPNMQPSLAVNFIIKH